MILLAGGTPALLEGLVQALATTGHRVLVASSLAEAADLQARDPAVLAVVERGLLTDLETTRSFVRLAIGSGSTLVTFREAGDVSRALPPAVARHVLADLVLPLERTRLVALAEHVASRARVVGRPADPSSPEPQAS